MQEINTEIYLKKKKNKKREYGRKIYHNMCEKKKKNIKKIIVKLIKIEILKKAEI